MAMLNRAILPLVLALWSVTSLLPLSIAYARTPLTRAVVEKFRNRVQLIPQNQATRLVQLRDVLVVGDAIATARASLVELRFNDGSLARLGEQALFRFAANTRTFHLSNGTVLLLIPPGNGRTTIRTPNAAAGIRGSGVFLRYVRSTNVSLVAALTDSDIEVYDPISGQWRVIEGGQMALVRNDRLEGIYEFDLRQFYETSPLTEGLALTALVNGTSPDNDPALDAVRAEIAAALTRQVPFTGNDVVTNPGFIRSTDDAVSNSEDFPPDTVTIAPLSPFYQPQTPMGTMDVGLGTQVDSRSIVSAGEQRSGQATTSDPAPTTIAQPTLQPLVPASVPVTTTTAIQPVTTAPDTLPILGGGIPTIPIIIGTPPGQGSAGNPTSNPIPPVTQPVILVPGTLPISGGGLQELP